MLKFPRLVTVFALGCLASAPAGRADTPTPEAPAYLFASQRGDDDGLHLAYGHDGLDWTDLDRVFFKPAPGSGAFRDPHLFRDDTGVFHLVWATGLATGPADDTKAFIASLFVR